MAKENLFSFKKLRKIILDGFEKEGKITPAYLEQNLGDQTLEEIDFETIAKTINETLYRNKIDQGNIRDFLDDDMIEKILSDVKPANQPKIKRRRNKKSYSLSQGTRLMIKMAENLSTQKI